MMRGLAKRKEPRDMKGNTKDNGTTKRGRTIRFSKRQVPNAAKWVKWLEENCEASAGPRCSLVGMRKMYWGREALIVTAGSYAYLITRYDDGRSMPWE